MSLGLGIFLAALLLSIVGLFATTKDRWNWMRIVKWAIGLPTLLVALLITGFWAHSKYDSRPVPQTEFQGLPLGASPADVRFLMGEPNDDDSAEDRWVFQSREGSSGAVTRLMVKFRDGKIHHIWYWADKQKRSHPYVLGFTIGSKYDSVIEKLGEPSDVSVSKDGLHRLLSFARYNVFFEFALGRIESFGIFDSHAGPVILSNETEELGPSAD